MPQPWDAVTDAHSELRVVYVTIATKRMLQALVGLERGYGCFNDPVFPDDEGLTLLPYDGCLTYEGELNKMAGNIALGRWVKRQ